MNAAIPHHELVSRWNRCRSLLQKNCPDVQGLLVFSRLNIYYFTGTMANGLLWLPLTDEPILFCRRGIERAKLESPLQKIFPFQSYRHIKGILQQENTSLPKTIAAEMNGLSWTLANSLTKYLCDHTFISGDRCIAMARAIKSEYELEILRRAGERHAHCLIDLLPEFLHEGISELEIAHKMSQLFYSQGHQGILRMENFGEQAFLGHIAIGDSANYPSVFNGAVGLRGVHPAVPYMGSQETKWRRRQPLIIDCGFSLEGYQTDMTTVYWLGDADGIPGSVQDAHNFCAELQDWIVAQLKPGILPGEIWDHCFTEAARNNYAEGFMGLGNNKVNFIGHGIGLAVDEIPVLTSGFDLPLEQGMVLAVEPKIGIQNVGMVGVENVYEVTESGGKSLTGNHKELITI